MISHLETKLLVLLYFYAWLVFTSFLSYNYSKNEKRNIENQKLKKVLSILSPRIKSIVIQ